MNIPYLLPASLRFRLPSAIFSSSASRFAYASASNVASWCLDFAIPLRLLAYRTGEITVSFIPNDLIPGVHNEKEKNTDVEFHIWFCCRTSCAFGQRLSFFPFLYFDLSFLHLLHSINLRGILLISFKSFQCTLLQNTNIRIVLALPLSPEFLIVLRFICSPLTRW